MPFPEKSSNDLSTSPRRPTRALDLDFSLAPAEDSSLLDSDRSSGRQRLVAILNSALTLLDDTLMEMQEEDGGSREQQ